MVLTDAGQLLADYLRRQHSQKQHILAQLESIQKMESGHVDVMVGEGFIDRLMRHSLRPFMKAHPGITLDLAVGNTDEIVRNVVEERAHIGVVFQPPIDERLRSHHMHQMPIQALMLDSHPLAALNRPLKLDDLAPYPVALLQRGFGVRQHIEAAEISEGVRLRPTLTTSSFIAIGHFVVAGLGYALSPRIPLPPDVASKRVITLPMNNPLLSQGRVEVVSRHGRLLSPAATALLRKIIRDIALLA